VDWRGAEPAADGGYDTRGGDGAELGRHPNGALLLIYSGGRFAGDGLFNFSGSDGKAGQEGKYGADSNRGLRGGGGGGGGAPGGDGGHLIVVAKDLDHQTTLVAEGGRGGPGGAAGSPKRGSSAGTAGEDGHTGMFDEYTHAQWQ
jgi:hypothetical protein